MITLALHPDRAPHFSYDASTITFIATKTDDLSCTEVIGALGLDDHPELVKVEAALDEALSGTEEWTATLEHATKEMKGEFRVCDVMSAALHCCHAVILVPSDLEANGISTYQRSTKK